MCYNKTTKREGDTKMLDEKTLRKITAIAEHLCGYEDDPWQGLE